MEWILKGTACAALAFSFGVFGLRAKSRLDRNAWWLGGVFFLCCAIAFLVK
jgi:hypothetical protein